MTLTTAQLASGLELTFSPDPELVPKIRDFVTELAERSKAGPDLTSQIELATHELVENAVKGTSQGLVRVRIEMRANREGMDVEVSTWNRASVWNLTCLRKAVGEVSVAVNAKDFYVDLMRRTAGFKGSGLGIGRVCAEAGMSVACEIEGDEARVVARLSSARS